MNKCYYVHYPLPCGEQKRGHKCPQPWKRKNYTSPLDVFLIGGNVSESARGNMFVSKGMANPESTKIAEFAPQIRLS
jgi:hypothetical protein